MVGQYIGDVNSDCTNDKLYPSEPIYTPFHFHLPLIVVEKHVERLWLESLKVEECHLGVATVQGIYITGGVTKKMREWLLKEGSFMKAYYDKGAVIALGWFGVHHKNSWRAFQLNKAQNYFTLRELDT